MLSIVPVSQIPIANDCPIAEPMLLYKTCLELVEVCTKENGVGLSAVQVGVPWHLYVVKYEKGYRFFVNCRYNGTSESKILMSVEGCLSLKDQRGRLKFYRLLRHTEVRISGFELIEGEDKANLVPLDEVESGFIGIVHQHEIDHGYGVLISDFGTEIDLRKIGQSLNRSTPNA
jgi:peptide deformylase